MPYQSFVPVTGIIREITPMTGECCNRMISIMSSGGITNFVVAPETFVVGCTRLRPGMRVAAFYDSDLPVPLIFPPQYRAEMITVLRPNENVKLDYFGKDLTSSDGTLSLNISRSTNVTTVNGQRFDCSPGGRILLVYYFNTTRSIPAQTTPEKIIVFC
ncbi:hypothetical protein [Ruminococcus gauvreauii]|uniref:hypothetical protein n=1 Tax=Ruminococcus gauvreauii TaxID=438033 RepID=UPI0039840170